MRKRRENFIVKKLNRVSIASKLVIMQIFCVILPLLITDSIVVHIIIQAEEKSSYQEMHNIASSLKYSLSDSLESAITMMQNIYSNRYVNEFIDEQFYGPLDYYTKQANFLKDSMYAVGINSNSYEVTVYGDNRGIIDGGYFQKVQNVEDKYWYQKLFSEKNEILLFERFEKDNWQDQRCIYLVRKMDYYHKGKGKSAVKLIIDYSKLLKIVNNASYSSTIYICDGSKIILSNDGKGGPYVDFGIIGLAERSNAAIRETMNVYGRKWDIYIMPQKLDYKNTILQNWPILGVMIAINLFLPFMLMHFINNSFTKRLKQLDTVFANVKKDELYPLPDIEGKDEISELMESYNKMADRINSLIEIEYKNRLKRQETNIARQRAELLALHSQINPHFLFNALESIRMHSIIKKEYETADMVEKLALMQRQYVEWGNDSVKIKDEIRFIEAYLELQKYRFGDRLMYDITVAPECEDYRLPKLTLVTFVENACVHGVENKTSTSWVFVKISKNDEKLVLEVEDTGRGMEEQERDTILKGIREVSIEKLQENRRIGVLNAALRLKMYSEEQVSFEIDSEIGSGTLVTISIPIATAEQMRFI